MSDEIPIGGPAGPAPGGNAPGPPGPKGPPGGNPPRGPGGPNRSGLARVGGSISSGISSSPGLIDHRSDQRVDLGQVRRIEARTQPGDRLDPQELVLEARRSPNRISGPTRCFRATISFGPRSRFLGRRTRILGNIPTKRIFRAELTSWTLESCTVMTFKAARLFRIDCSASRTWKASALIFDRRRRAARRRRTRLDPVALRRIVLCEARRRDAGKVRPAASASARPTSPGRWRGSGRAGR